MAAGQLRLPLNFPEVAPKDEPGASTRHLNIASIKRNAPEQEFQKLQLLKRCVKFRFWCSFGSVALCMRPVLKAD